MVNPEKYANNRYKLYIICILFIIMYWTDWSYGKRRLTSKLEQLFTPPEKNNYFERIFCFCNKKDKEENQTDSICYEEETLNILTNPFSDN